MAEVGRSSAGVGPRVVAISLKLCVFWNGLFLSARENGKVSGHDNADSSGSGHQVHDKDQVASVHRDS